MVLSPHNPSTLVLLKIFKHLSQRVLLHSPKGATMKPHVVTSFKPHNQGLAKIFGSLEASIIELIWQHEPASARTIFEALRDQGQRLSYGATKTVLDRLVQKHILNREMDVHQYLYSAEFSRAEFNKKAISEVLDSLVASFGTSVIAQFLNRVADADHDELDQLQQLINEAREQS